MTLPFYDTSLWTLALAAFSALIIGISKTSVGGAGAISVAIFAHLMDPKESTAAILLLLIVGDIVAVKIYHAHADWKLLWRLLPAVIPGVIGGAIFLRFVSSEVLKPLIGVTLAVMVVLQLWQRRKKKTEVETVAELHPGWGVGAGLAAGFTTMTANAAGPVMALYLLAAKVDKTKFLGTGAWYFLIINVSKVPFSTALGFYHWSTLWMLVVLAPVVLIGTWLGRILIKRISQIWFERVTLVASAAGAVSLLI